MSASGGSNSGAVGSEKAHFINDDQNTIFFVQFNPKEFKLDESATWKDSQEFHVDKPLLEFDKGKPSQLSFELIFDTTDSGDDVRTEWTSKLAAFLAVTEEPKEPKKPGTRPPHCTFVWGGFTFEGVIESISSNFLMFSSDGTPLRAKLAVKMKERSEDLGKGTAKSGVTLAAPASLFTGGGNRNGARSATSPNGPETNDGSTAGESTFSDRYTATQQATGFTGVSTYTVQEGDTLSGIALSLAIEFMWIAAANNVDDPMNLTPGDTLIIPPSEQEASVFEHLPADLPADWADYDPQLNEDSDLADIFAIYDGSWDPFAEQELEELGAETAFEEGSAQMGGEWALSDYEGKPPEPTKFEHGESGSADIFSIYASDSSDDEEEEEAEAGGEAAAPAEGSGRPTPRKRDS